MHVYDVHLMLLQNGEVARTALVTGTVIDLEATPCGLARLPRQVCYNSGIMSHERYENLLQSTILLIPNTSVFFFILPPYILYCFLSVLLQCFIHIIMINEKFTLFWKPRNRLYSKDRYFKLDSSARQFTFSPLKNV